MKKMSKIYTALIFAFLFAPIVILLIFSFTDSKSPCTYDRSIQSPISSLGL